MKTGIHPQIHMDATVTCSSCGAIFKIPGTVKEISIEICSNCHPVYTGKFRAITSSGRVDKFQKKLAAAKKEEAVKKPKKRKLTAEEKLRTKLEEAREEKEAKKKEIAKVQRERAKKAAEKTVVQKGKGGKNSGGKKKV